jgi:hypothetical protein
MSSRKLSKEYVFREQSLHYPLESSVSRVLHRTKLFTDFNKAYLCHLPLLGIDSGLCSGDSSLALFKMATYPDVSVFDVIDAVRYYSANPNQIIDGTTFLSRLAETGTGRTLNVLYFVLSHCTIPSPLFSDRAGRSLLMHICNSRCTRSPWWFTSPFLLLTSVDVLQEKIIQLLLTKFYEKDEFDKLDCENCSALFYAWKNRNIVLMKFLLEKGASVMHCVGSFVSSSEGLSVLANLANDIDETFLTEFSEKNAGLLSRLVDYRLLSRRSQAVTPEELEIQSDGMVLFRALEELVGKKASLRKSAHNVSCGSHLVTTRRRNKWKKVQQRKDKLEREEICRRGEDERIIIDRLERQFPGNIPKKADEPLYLPVCTAHLD